MSSYHACCSINTMELFGETKMWTVLESVSSHKTWPNVRPASDDASLTLGHGCRLTRMARSLDAARPSITLYLIAIDCLVWEQELNFDGVRGLAAALGPDRWFLIYKPVICFHDSAGAELIFLIQLSRVISTSGPAPRTSAVMFFFPGEDGSWSEHHSHPEREHHGSCKY